MESLPDYENIGAYKRWAENVMTPLEESIEAFRASLEGKITDAFKKFPVDAKSRWEIMATEANNAYAALTPHINLSPYDSELLVDHMLDACFFNDEHKMYETVMQMGAYIRVFERRMELAK